LDSTKALELGAKIQEIQTLMIAYVTDGRTPDQPRSYKQLYDEVYIDLEESKYANPNPHKSLEVFWAFCKLQEMTTYASRRAYIQEIYSDILLELKRIQRHVASSKNWKKANEVLEDNLSPIRTQWLKAKNFIYAPIPDFENSIKESINSIESCLMVLLEAPNGTLGKIIKSAALDADIGRLISQAYGFASNKDFVRHGGTGSSGIDKEEAEFFLEFSATAIVYITSKLKK
jgi:hypothetical protein